MFPCLHSLLKTSAKFVRILKQVKTLDYVSTASRVFTDLLSKSPKRSPPFSPGYEGTQNMFYFLIKTLWSAIIKAYYNICATTLINPGFEKGS